MKVKIGMNAEPATSTEMAKRPSDIRVRPKGLNPREVLQESNK
jgi:hypothetical protein